MSGKVRMGFSLSWFVHARARLLGAANQDARVVVKDFGETVPFNKAGIFFVDGTNKTLPLSLATSARYGFSRSSSESGLQCSQRLWGPGLNQSAIVLTKPRLLELQTSTLGW